MTATQAHEKIIILDFGSQYTQLIARRIREQGVLSEIVSFNSPVDGWLNDSVKGIILSGGPSSVYAENAPHIGKNVFDAGKPLVGICYGLQLLMEHFDGKVAPAEKREYGRATLEVNTDCHLFSGVASRSIAWMSHGDRVEKAASGFRQVASTENSPFAAVEHESGKIFGLQFHPEVQHTEQGTTILRNFVFDICGCEGDWSTRSFIDESISDIRERVGGKKIVCGLSGGVDSSVVAVLLHEAIGEQLHCIFVDTGLLRKNEVRQVEDLFRKHYSINLMVVDESAVFLGKLAGVTDPEKKRKIIGNLFIEIFDREANTLGGIEFLAQGTLYPDVIESVSFKGPSATIKSHHNVGGLPEKMKMKLIEPLRELFKDEVRAVGRELGLPELMISRHPFPGPGLAVRILGEVTADRVHILQLADDIYISELVSNNLYHEIWQAFAVLLPVQTVGVMGDERTYENTLALRAVSSTDGMTANWYPLPYDFMEIVSGRIINEVEGINRVVYDISSKPPATIEWE